jgi:hypothetical protein
MHSGCVPTRVYKHNYASHRCTHPATILPESELEQPIVYPQIAISPCIPQTLSPRILGTTANYCIARLTLSFHSLPKIRNLRKGKA